MEMEVVKDLKALVVVVVDLVHLDLRLPDNYQLEGPNAISNTQWLISAGQVVRQEDPQNPGQRAK